MKEIVEHHLVVNRTARYYTLGEVNDQPGQVWFVLHGYAQLAGEFIQSFKELEDEKIMFVAPEGLSRFYAKGFAGNVAATWMTREDRENEINDYVSYLNMLHEKISRRLPRDTVYNMLGFSQGVATAVRWFTGSEFKVSKFILWAGEFPPDTFLDTFKNRLGNTKFYYAFGTQDPYVKDEIILKYDNAFRNSGIECTKFSFEGAHEIHKETMKRILDE